MGMEGYRRARTQWERDRQIKLFVEAGEMSIGVSKPAFGPVFILGKRKIDDEAVVCYEDGRVCIQKMGWDQNARSQIPGEI